MLRTGILIQELKVNENRKPETAIRDVRLLFMSGTGNTRRVAEWVGQTARERGLAVECHSIESREALEMGSPGRETMVGLFAPTHGFTTPWLMMKFLFKLPRARGAVAFAVATRGGTYATTLGRKDGKARLSVPGLAGTAAWLIVFMLMIKGYRVRGVIHADMPSNWMSLHPSLTEKRIGLVLDYAGRRLKRYAARLLDGKKVFFTPANIWELAAGIALLPVSAGYLAIGHIGLAKLFFATRRCNGCGACARNCLADAIIMRGQKPDVRPFWTYKCESCMRCMAYCTRQAIEASQSFGVLLFYMMFLPMSTWGLTRLADLLPGLNVADNLWLQTIIFFIWCYPATILAYHIFYRLSRIPGVDRVLAYTTLTAFYKRYHEPETRLSDFRK